jgi:hypothetical protein
MHQLQLLGSALAYSTTSTFIVALFCESVHDVLRRPEPKQDLKPGVESLHLLFGVSAWQLGMEVLFHEQLFLRSAQNA